MSEPETRPSPHRGPTARRRVDKRLAAERRFRVLGLAALLVGLSFVLGLFLQILVGSLPAFQQAELRVEVEAPAPGETASPRTLLTEGLETTLELPHGERSQARRLRRFFSMAAPDTVEEWFEDHPGAAGRVALWVPVDDDVDWWMKGELSGGALERRFDATQQEWLERLRQQGRLERHFNTQFFVGSDSREPELSGVLGAAVGSFYTLLVTLLLSFPIGVATAVYLEEFAPKNRWMDWLEVNINNLAAVPSIVFGLLGLAVFINFLALPRSAPIVGGLVLSLMTLPTIIIASRAALRAVPPSIREAALGVGASKTQALFHHVIPLAMPGMLTGAIIGMAQAAGETAPLLMIGMVAFIADVPAGIFDPATVLPVQVFLWSDSPELAFAERTYAAIFVLLVFLMAMNALAVILRRRFEKRW